jgi:iron complex outermembrane receptor protein
VQNDSLNLGGRFEYRFNDDWNGTLSASRSKVVIDDYSAFAWGSSEGAFFGQQRRLRHL